MVGWGNGSQILNYIQAVANTRMVARVLELTLKRLNREAGLDLKDVHLIGHSLGAQISGNTGRQLSGKVGRISGKFTVIPLSYGFLMNVCNNRAHSVNIIIMRARGSLDA